MPTVLRIDGLRAVVYPNDHRPAHVHVLGADATAVFVLNCPGGPVVLRECYGFTTQALNRIAEALTINLSKLCGDWESIHGRY